MGKKGIRIAGDHEVFSVFGQLEAVAAGIMVAQGKARLIPFEQIPEEVRYNYNGQAARFACVLPKKSIREYEKLVMELRQ